MSIQDLDFRLIVALYGAGLSTYIFLRSIVRRVIFAFDFDPNSSAQRLKLTAFSRSGQEIFVHKVIVYTTKPANTKEVEIREFLKPYEVKSWSFAENVVGVKNLSKVEIVASGRVRLASKSV